MKKLIKYFLPVLTGLLCIAFVGTNEKVTAQNSPLKVVFIRHGEKPEKGGNLTCKGLNRSLMLPALITGKFGVPNFVYVPTLKMDEKTSHARMFETVVPLAAKYNLEIDSKYDEKDSAGVATDIMQKTGTVLVVWEHKAIRGILHSLGVQDAPKWSDDDYDTILIVTIANGKATLTKDSEGLKPSDNCP
jgi:hypothetical protein